MFGFIKRAKKYWVSDVSFITLLIFLFFLVFFFPSMIDRESENTYFLNLMFIFLFIVGIFSAREKGFVIGAILLVSIHIFLRLIRFSDNPHEYYILERIVIIVNLILFIVINFRLLFRDYQVSYYRIVGAINVYLSMALLGAFAFELVNLVDGDSIIGNIDLSGNENDYGDYIYFSLTCISTVGFGDVYPINVHAKMIATFLSVLGVLYPAIVIAKLVSLGSQKK
ncbi:two pore domain potassium channel family protein [Cyclobacteriaceae bacterium YHN15]|nr:two pore domain potassium channel family protein [Cyclobacteriaceae bacterium YHN15]